MHDERRLRRDVDRFLRTASGAEAVANKSMEIEALRLIGFTPGMVRVLDHLALESGNPPSVVLPGALGLYKIGLDAEREGHHLAIIDRDGGVVQ